MKLYGEPGWGSVLVEAQLDWYGFEYDFERVGDLFKSAASRRKLASINPLAQVPTLVMADGTLLTESAAITLRLADLGGDETLVPGPGAPERASFLRWLIFIVANIYPTFTYADDPSRFVERPDAQAEFRNSVGDYAKRLYGVLASSARKPWYLGERFTALDIYICAMTRWRPGRRWFETNEPALHAIAMATENIDRLRAVWQRNAPEGETVSADSAGTNA
jgi:GST-like protein